MTYQGQKMTLTWGQIPEWPFEVIKRCRHSMRCDDTSTMQFIYFLYVHNVWSYKQKLFFVRKRSLFMAHEFSAIDRNQMWMSVFFLYHVKSYLSLFWIYSSLNSSWDMPDVLRIAFLDEFLTSFIWPKIDLSSFCTPLLSIYVFLSLVDTMCGSWDKRRGGGLSSPSSAQLARNPVSTRAKWMIRLNGNVT